jgi:hypothetical protein
MLAGMVGVTLLACAGEQTLTIRDWTGRGFASEVIGYDVPSAGAANLRVTGPDGSSLPVPCHPGCRWTVRAETRYEIDYAGGETYRCTVRVDARESIAEVIEEYDLKGASQRAGWDLDLAATWPAARGLEMS